MYPKCPQWDFICNENIFFSSEMNYIDRANLNVILDSLTKFEA